MQSESSLLFLIFLHPNFVEMSFHASAGFLTSRTGGARDLPTAFGDHLHQDSVSPEYQEQDCDPLNHTSMFTKVATYGSASLSNTRQRKVNERAV